MIMPFNLWLCLPVEIFWFQYLLIPLLVSLKLQNSSKNTLVGVGKYLKSNRFCFLEQSFETNDSGYVQFSQLYFSLEQSQDIDISLLLNTIAFYVCWN